MILPYHFVDFLTEIRPTKSQTDDYKQGHTLLRERLHADDGLKEFVVETFLQGSYRRATAIRPKNLERGDVDVVVVTTLSRSLSPEAAMQLFVPFLEKHYPGKWRLQGRSFGISLSHVDLDLVITAAPSQEQAKMFEFKAVTEDFSIEEEPDWRLAEAWIPVAERKSYSSREIVKTLTAADEWKSDPLYIPNRDKASWDKTHPLAQIQWTRDKNKRTDGHYVNVVKAIKWWRRFHLLEMPAHPKGYPLEHLVGHCCPDHIASVAEGVVKTLEAFVANFGNYATLPVAPIMPDHGVPEHNVFGRVSGADFANFYEQAKLAAITAREAYDDSEPYSSAEKWRRLFGSKFPLPAAKAAESKGFTPREGPSELSGERFA